MKLSSLSLSLVLAVWLPLLFVLGCAPAEQADETRPTSQSEPAHNALLPAYPLPGERERAGKADQFSELRHQYPSTFGITTPPSQPVTAVAQWEDHQALLLTWTGNFPKTYAQIVDASKDKLDVYVVHDGAGSRQEFTSAIGNYGVTTAGVNFVDMSHDSLWMRDYGPLSVRTDDGAVAFVDPRYYHGRPLDDALPSRLAVNWGVTSYRQPLDWEGGTYIADGRGTCLYTNGVYQFNGIPQSQIHAYQNAYLGCKTNIVQKPLIDEGTTHSDMFSKMLAPGHVLLGRYDSAQDHGNHLLLEQNAQILSAAVLADGGTLKISRMPMPNNNGRQVWRTYVNSLFVNGVNLVPVYNDERSREAAAMAAWKSAMPTWKHVSIDATDLIHWAGAVHCITMTVPNGQLTPVEQPEFLCGGDYACYPQLPTGGAAPVNTTAPSANSTVATGPTCAQIGTIGCCDGDALLYCDGGQMKKASCDSCGWSASGNNGNGWYDCGGIAADPSGSYPLSCGASSSVATPIAEPEPSTPTSGCGSETWAGRCNGDTLIWCEDSQVKTYECAQLGAFKCGADAADGGFDCVETQSTCTPSCDGKSCGQDGCGGVCGLCPGGSTCAAGQCTAQSACGGITYEGCCAGSTLKWCEGGSVRSNACGGGGCGWNTGASYYDCNQSGAGPASHPFACPQ